ncbi:hypothetical protein NPZ62_20540, partial [Salmonella enterica]|nr:hypothetical protein [Salmonella enterica]
MTVAVRGKQEFIIAELDSEIRKIRLKLTDSYEEGVRLSSGTFTGTVAKLAMRQPFVLFKGLTFQKLCLP